jgi:hypothetical protein
VTPLVPLAPESPPRSLMLHPTYPGAGFFPSPVRLARDRGSKSLSEGRMLNGSRWFEQPVPVRDAVLSF